jgi:hypothetical protein
MNSCCSVWQRRKPLAFDTPLWQGGPVIRRWRERRLLKRLLRSEIERANVSVTKAQRELRIASASWRRELERVSSSPRCPTCGAGLQARTGRNGAAKGRTFWGCSRWPSCNYAAPIWYPVRAVTFEDAAKRSADA